MRSSDYLRWLQRFLAGPGGDSRLSAQDAQRVFVEQLERDGDRPEWQVRQAARAVELYQIQYLRYRAEMGDTPVAVDAPPVPVRPITLEAAMEGDKDRSTLLPSCLQAPLKVHLQRVKELRNKEMAAGHGDVELPNALATKYPKAAWE